MAKRINVLAIPRASRGVYVLRYNHPITKRQVVKFTNVKIGGTKNAKQAERLAQELQTKLEAGELSISASDNWRAFRQRYEQNHLANLADASRSKALTVLDLVERMVHMTSVADVTEETLEYLLAQWRKQGLSVNTIKGYLVTFRAALGWAKRNRIIGTVPTMPELKRAKSSTAGTPLRGRAIDRAELERMQRAARDYFGPDKSPPWERYLEALWLSGLRLEESMRLSWADGASIQVVTTRSAKYGSVYMLRFKDGSQKRGGAQELPLALDFVKWLSAIPLDDRGGYVFNLPKHRGDGEMRNHRQVGRVVTRLGKLAGVAVSHNEDGTPSKWASAHDLRRSFGSRLAANPKVSIFVLKQMMRHESIETTERYYITQKAIEAFEQVADAQSEPVG